MQKELAVSAKAAIILAVVRVIDRQNKIAKAAREAGEAAGREWGIQLGIEIGMKRAGELIARELHNFKFPDGKIDHENDALKQYAPKDDSTFEFTYQTYTERVMAKEAARRVRGEREDAQRNVRRRRSNRTVAKNRRNRQAKISTDFSKINDDHGYDELLAEEGIYVKE
jgi:hypothetical protein